MTYRYARIGGAYVAMDRSLVEVSWRLLTCQPLLAELRRARPGGTLARLPPRARGLYQVLRFVAAVAGARLGLRLRRPTLRLAIDGHVALPLNLGGHKVIDLERRTVVTLFDPDGDVEPIRDHVRRSERVAQRPFAPSVIAADVEGRTLVETFVNGAPTPMTDDVLLPLVTRIILAEEPHDVSLSDYLGRRLETLTDLSLIEHPDDRERVRRFTHRVAERVGSLTEARLGLVLSHGDLWPGNVLTERGVVYAIDWGASDHRSAFYDLHFALFIPYEAAAADAGALERVADRLARGSETVRANVRAHAGAERAATLFPEGLSDSALRWIFYLEFLASCLQECGGDVGEAVRAHRTRRMTTLIRVFDAYERLVPA